MAESVRSSLEPCLAEGIIIDQKFSETCEREVLEKNRKCNVIEKIRKTSGGPYGYYGETEHG